MKRALLGASALAFAYGLAFAGQPVTINNAGNTDSVTVTNHKLDVNATTTVGGFTPSASGARGTPLAVGVTDSSGNLPTGATVTITNVGSNPMYCNVNGVAATTSDQLITTSGGGWSPTIPNAVTTLHCIATGGSTTANMLGGSGLATTNWGGGGGGSGSNASVGSTGAAVPGSATYVGITSGGNLTGWDTSVKQATGTNLHAVIDTGSTTAVTQATGTNLHAVLDTTSTTAVTQATAANLNATTTDTALELSQGSTTSGQKGPLTQGAVTTGGPTYTAGQTYPLSLDTSGNLRVNVVAGAAGNAAASTTGSAVPASGDFIAGGAAAGAGNLTGATVKAGSTAAAATDTAIVTQSVALGNSTLSAAVTAATAPANGLAVLCKADITSGLTLTNGQTGALQCDGVGRLTVSEVPNGATAIQGSASTSSNTAVTLLADPGVGVVNTVLAVQCWNTSAVTITMTFNDAASTQIIVPQTYGNNITFPAGSPLTVASHTAFTFTPSASETSDGCAAQGYKK